MSSHGKEYQYFAYARNLNEAGSKADNENINTYYGFNDSGSYRLSTYEGPERLLTFPGDVSTNPDLQYFRAGDLVQGFDAEDLDYYNILAGPNEAHGDQQLIDATILSVAETVEYGVRPKNTTHARQLVWDFINSVSNVTIVKYSTGSATGFLYGSETGLPDTWILEATGRVSDTDEVTSTNNKYRYYMFHKDSGDMNPANYGIPDSILDRAVHVVSTNLANNTMVVDGGKWLGSDGSGEADSDRHVEYQTKGGQGNVIKIDNKDIYLSDTGGRDNRWIAENKATTPFYVGTPSKVTGEILNKKDVEFISWNGTPETREFTLLPPSSTDSVDLVKRYWYLRESSTLDGLTGALFVKYTEDLTLKKERYQDPGQIIYQNSKTTLSMRLCVNMNLAVVS